MSEESLLKDLIEINYKKLEALQKERKKVQKEF